MQWLAGAVKRGTRKLQLLVLLSAAQRWSAAVTADNNENIDLVLRHLHHFEKRERRFYELIPL